MWAWECGVRATPAFRRGHLGSVGSAGRFTGARGEFESGRIILRRLNGNCKKKRVVPFLSLFIPQIPSMKRAAGAGSRLPGDAGVHVAVTQRPAESSYRTGRCTQRCSTHGLKEIKYATTRFRLEMPDADPQLVTILDAIREEPDDAERWHALSDWLMVHGQDDEAAAVRVLWLTVWGNLACASLAETLADLARNVNVLGKLAREVTTGTRTRVSLQRSTTNSSARPYLSPTPTRTITQTSLAPPTSRLFGTG
jgi:hypothetical protein